MIYGQPAEFKEAEAAIKKIEDETDDVAATTEAATDEPEA